MQPEDPITSAAQATKEARRLKSVWSRESYLSLRTLIYCASLLERIANQKSPKRKASAWQRFLSARLKAGRSIVQAADEWRQRKTAGAGPE